MCSGECVLCAVVVSKLLSEHVCLSVCLCVLQQCMQMCVCVGVKFVFFLCLSSSLTSLLRIVSNKPVENDCVKLKPGSSGVRVKSTSVSLMTGHSSLFYIAKNTEQAPAHKTDRVCLLTRSQSIKATFLSGFCGLSLPTSPPTRSQPRALLDLSPSAGS